GGGGRRPPHGRMWRDQMASALEQVAATDDLTLLRAAKGADQFEVGFMEFVSNFPGVEIVPAPEGGFYGFTLGLVKLDRNLRGEVLRAYAAELRKSKGKTSVYPQASLRAGLSQ
ncbi:hypothetical protein, partial [Pseudomonas avellanae]